MVYWLFYLSLLKVLGPTWCAISVNRVVIRTPKDGDIGLIFDISVINTAIEEKELLEYRIRPENECCVNLTENSMTFKAGKILGGSFGQIEPGALKTISLIWPTTAIFNRVGHCDVIIISTNVKNEEKEIRQQLQFDTRFSSIDPTGTTFRRRKEYLECSNWDMDFLNNCTPVNCDEKYLGRRSFYNITTKMCEPVPKCAGNSQVYDIYSNECMDLSKLMNADDIEDIKRGKYENNSLDLSRSSVLATIVIYTTVCFFIFLLVNWLSKLSARPRSPNIIPNRTKE